MSDPLTPPDCDLRDFAFMPLDVVRLRDSDLASTEPPEVCWSALLLWCASWHQVPAASLPDDDRVLANLAGFGRVVREWQRIRDAALRGWVKCSDGRLYHPVVAEKARDAWRGKLIQRWKTECSRIKKHYQRHGLGTPTLPEFEDWMSQGCPQGQAIPVPEDKKPLSPGTPPPRPRIVPGETGSKGEGEGEGEGQGEMNTKGAIAPLSPPKPATAVQPDLPEVTPIPVCPTKQLAAMFALKCPGLPKPRYELWKDSAGADAMRQRWRWLLSADAVREDGSRYAENPAQAIEWFGRFFDAVHASDFLSGRSGAWKGCDLAWLMKRENFVKVIQGNYDNERKAA